MRGRKLHIFKRVFCFFRVRPNLADNYFKWIYDVCVCITLRGGHIRKYTHTYTYKPRLYMCIIRPKQRIGVCIFLTNFGLGSSYMFGLISKIITNSNNNDNTNYYGPSKWQGSRNGLCRSFCCTYDTCKISTLRTFKQCEILRFRHVLSLPN